MGVQFTNGNVNDVEPLRTFMAQMYAPGYVLSRSRPFLQWQFAGIPSASRPGIDMKLALVDGVIAGCLGFIPVDLTMAGRQVRGAWAANWMVDEQYRRLGLGPLLIRELVKEFDVTLALGGNRDAHALLPRMGWTDFGDLRRYVAVIDRDAASQIGDASDLPAAAVTGGTGRRVFSLSDEATRLWDRLSADIAGTRRTAEYLTWRYAAHPLFDYRIFELREAGQLAGVGIYRLEKARGLPLTIARIVELIAAPEAAAPLLTTMIADAAVAGAGLADFFCPLARLQRPLTAAGFTHEAASRFPMLFQPIDRSRTGVLFMADLRKSLPAAELGEWYVTTADGDQDRPN